MPWDAILGGATGGVALSVVAIVLLFKLLVEKTIVAFEKRYESALKRSDEVQSSTLAMLRDTRTATLSMMGAVDTDLRKRRADVYAELWKKTGALPQWPRNRDLTYRDLLVLSKELKTWYFETGGMYLSAKARATYGDLQEEITSVLQEGTEGMLRDRDYDVVRLRCSALRSELTADLLSRREAPEIPAGNPDVPQPVVAL
jgi:hypothetical protein